VTQAVVAAWLNAVINDGVPPDQNWLAIEKYFKQKFASATPPKVPGAGKINNDAIACAFLKEINEGQHIHSKTGELFDQLLQDALAQNDVEAATDDPHVDELRRENAHFKAELERVHATRNDTHLETTLKARLREAQEWRFRLEQAVRGAHTELENFLLVHERAPSQMELGRIVARLDAALL